mmetsp:Transcript_89011/g.238306  ORF Transcript_89011/g.238306 Transcript_89011/m.238306 type:complete len:322 (-) Transcript_89011:166-1131(-)
MCTSRHTFTTFTICRECCNRVSPAIHRSTAESSSITVRCSCAGLIPSINSCTEKNVFRQRGKLHSLFRSSTSQTCPHPPFPTCRTTVNRFAMVEPRNADFAALRSKSVLGSQPGGWNKAASGSTLRRTPGIARAWKILYSDSKNRSASRMTWESRARISGSSTTESLDHPFFSSISATQTCRATSSKRRMECCMASRDTPAMHVSTPGAALEGSGANSRGTPLANGASCLGPLGEVIRASKGRSTMSMQVSRSKKDLWVARYSIIAAVSLRQVRRQLSWQSLFSKSTSYSGTAPEIVSIHTEAMPFCLSRRILAVCCRTAS